MSLRFQWRPSQDAIHLLSEPHLGFVQSRLAIGSVVLHPKLYFSYNAMTQQTTIITTDLNRSHLWLIQHLKELSGTIIRPEEIALLLIKCFVVIQECFGETAEWWDDRVNNPVCYKTLYLHLYSVSLPCLLIEYGITIFGQPRGP